ncbi:hypothetical protein BC829DRAFT_424649 [Chytridium lagenaria]|nr:hypothetical protein BC829DRAFT_424649 [Chytridium lagenaria]
MKRGEVERLQEELETGGPNSEKKTTSGTLNGALFSSKKNDDVQFNDDHIDLPLDEIIGRLRARGEPIRLFGETDRDRVRRLKVLESREERTEGQRNDFQSLLDSADRGLALELLRNRVRSRPHCWKKILRRLITHWHLPEKGFEGVGKDSCSKTRGSQTGEYLKPFMKQLKNNSVKEDILQREYLKANASYLQLSIGNAPWPIGVTMVGIHERSAREKIHASQVAHVLNDEVQRKWIPIYQAHDDFAQTRWPPDDLGKAIG